MNFLRKVLVQYSVASLTVFTLLTSVNSYAAPMDDPKFVMVNPVSFKAITKAKQDDLVLAVMQSEEARRQYHLRVASDVLEAEEMGEPLERMYKEYGDAVATALPDAVATALSPNPRKWEQTGATPE